jgi:hypothetical protein
MILLSEIIPFENRDRPYLRIFMLGIIKSRRVYSEGIIIALLDQGKVMI